jgi:hypothetical protein
MVGNIAEPPQAKNIVPMENENDLKVIELGSGLGSLLASISILIIINTQAIAVHTIAPIAIGLNIKKSFHRSQKTKRSTRTIVITESRSFM